MKAKIYYSRISLLLILTILLTISCEENITSLENNNISTNYRVYLGVEGNNSSLLLYDDENFELETQLQTEPGSPLSLAYSNKKNEIYSVWKTNDGDQLFQLNGESLTPENSIKSQFPNRLCLNSSDGKFIILAGRRGFEVYNAQDLSTYYINTEERMYDDASLSNSTNNLYLSKYGVNSINDFSFTEVAVFNIETKEKIKTLPLFRDYALRSADMKVSNDEKYLFISAFNWIAGGGYNIFFVVDLKTESIIYQTNTGAFSQLAPDINNNYVYLSDPAGFLYPFGHMRIHKILRYNIQNQTMEDFFVLEESGKINASVFTTTYLTVSPDNKYLFACVEGNVKTTAGERVDLIKIEIRTGKIVDTFAFELEDNKLTKRIRAIKVIKKGDS